MSTELFVALTSAVVAIASAGFAFWGQSKSARVADELQGFRKAEERRLEREQSVARYREPLGRAAYDLQSRLFNILNQGFLNVYYTNGSDRERSYALENTVFLTGQYFAWTEIIRRDIQYLDLGADDKTRELARLQDAISSLWQTTEFSPLFRVFAGEQRAIGERMIRESQRGPECVGYAAFLDEAPKHQDELLNALRLDIRNFSTCLPDACPRLVAIQNAIIDLLHFLDPDNIRFPKERRTKVVC